MTAKRCLGWVLPAIAAFTFASCESGKGAGNLSLDSAAIQNIISNAPVLKAAQSLQTMQVEPGFQIQLVAEEPLLSTPVAMNFDEKGRMWVVEMNGYMHDTLATGEDIPNGAIVILEDTDGNGVMDKRNVFWDSLVLPRAICLIENGALVAVPPQLLFVENNKDKAGKVTVVDTAYNGQGNVEHESNGLIRGIDNWVYSANSNKRYRKTAAGWLTEPTHYRGQWGITQDDYGRLLYNNNSQNMLGDYFLPGMGTPNKFKKNTAGYNVRITDDNRVYPARPTTGVNRGYREKELDSTGRLVNFTAACGPVIYRSDLFGKEYYNNVFVAEPSANLIKRNILKEEGIVLKGEQAYKGKEFLTSIDERFRPVNLYTGPDGALYILDMYRGIIQHKFYLTEYLKGEIKKRSLTQPLNCGRIYKVVPVGVSKNKVQQFPGKPADWIALLSSGNGWMRDKAQQLLVDGKHTALADTIRHHLLSETDNSTKLRLLWTLEGLGVLQQQDVLPLLNSADWKVKMHAIAALASTVNESSAATALDILQQQLQSADTAAVIAATYQLKTVAKFSKTAIDEILKKLLIDYGRNPYIADAILSNYADEKEGFYNNLLKQLKDTAASVYKSVQLVLSNIEKEKSSSNEKLLAKTYPTGSTIYNTVCQSCHGKNGAGITMLAPPLNKSEWVTGDVNKLIAIVLKGASGPITVGNKLYKAPEISGEMPGIGANPDITDEGLAQLLSYIRKNWNNNASEVKISEVTAVRAKLAERQQPFTEAELKKLK